ncbi:helix-turn-helix transcriptional regulator [Candidatus Binatus sp.]|uniref:helix-turn-helix transcriptional regulator n=1 Tax=Candidatus Binatus sp. TaxID=2811406 RepID=UPI002FD9DC3F
MLPEVLHIDPSAIPSDQIPAVLSALAALQGALAARLIASPEAATKGSVADNDHDTLLTVAETAERLRRSPKWVYRRVKTLPFARKLGNRAWVFSEKGLGKWLAQRRA